MSMAIDTAADLDPIRESGHVSGPIQFEGSYAFFPSLRIESICSSPWRTSLPPIFGSTWI